MEQEDQEAQKPLLVTAAGRSGDGYHLASSGAASSSSSIAVVVASTAVAVAGSFEFGISVIMPSLCSVCYSMLRISCLYGVDNQARRQLRPKNWWYILASGKPSALAYPGKLISSSCILQVGYSSPSQPGIMRDLNLSLAEVPSCKAVKDLTEKDTRSCSSTTDTNLVQMH